MFYVSVTTTNPKTSQSIANAVAEVASGEIARIIKAGGANVIDYAKEPKSPSSPNIKRNIFLGLLIAFAVSFVYFFVREAFNATITSVKDLEREFQIPVLGTIPRLVATRDKQAPPTDSGQIAPPTPCIHERRCVTMALRRNKKNPDERGFSRNDQKRKCWQQTPPL